MKGIQIKDVDFIETDNDGAIVVTLKDGTKYTFPGTMALVFQNDRIVIG